MNLANEQALTVAMLRYAKDHSISDLSSLTVLGFKNGYHGNTIPTLSCSDPTLNIHNSPTFDWPIADFPNTKFPMSTYEHENRAEEDRCLDNVRNLIKTG